MFGLLYRLLIFVLLVWLAKTAITLVVRLFRPAQDRMKIHRGESSPAPPETKGPPAEDIIDVSYTEVDAQKK